MPNTCIMHIAIMVYEVGEDLKSENWGKIWKQMARSAKNICLLVFKVENTPLLMDASSFFYLPHLIFTFAHKSQPPMGCPGLLPPPLYTRPVPCKLNSLYAWDIRRSWWFFQIIYVVIGSISWFKLCLCIYNF